MFVGQIHVSETRKTRATLLGRHNLQILLHFIGFDAKVEFTFLEEFHDREQTLNFILGGFSIVTFF